MSSEDHLVAQDPEFWVRAYYTGAPDHCPLISWTLLKSIDV
jgi:hypothetical protein